MSGLEVFGIVCNVIQVLSFSHEIISTCKQIYRDGAAVSDRSLAEVALQMRSTSTALQEFIGKDPQPLTKDQSDLIDFTKSCINASQKLSTEVDKITVQGNQSRGRFQSIKLTFKRTWKKSKIEGLEKDLNRLQGALETQYLKRLCNQQDAITLLHQDNFKSIDQTLRNFVERCSLGDMKIEDLIKTNTESIKAHTTEQREINESNVSEVIKQNTTSAMAHTTQERQVIDRHISSEHEATREHTSKQSDNVKNHLSNLITNVSTLRLSEAQRTKLMESLDFSGRNERLNSVTEAHSKSFHWLFGNSRKDDDSDEDVETKSEYGVEELDDSGDEMENTDDDKYINDWILDDLLEETKRSTWDSFGTWLQSDDKLYWVAGKAGAGKSTLMKFLYSNSKTKLLLDSRGHGESLILCYLFYLMGKEMQHNIKGLLSTLLYQILEQDINGDLTTNLLSLFPALRNKKSEKDWSQLDLRNVLLEALRQVSVTRPVFILVDGLDEIRPIHDVHRLPELFKELCRHKLKLCISSREEQVFKVAFGSEPHLQLHNLAAPDMYRFAIDRFNSSADHFPSDLPAPTRRRLRGGKWFYPRAGQILAETVAEKSEGVFLWAHLALGSLERAFCNMDTWQIIQERLEEMPSELEQLYSSMWERLNKDTKRYRPEAALYFNLVIEFPDLEATYYPRGTISVGEFVPTIAHFALSQEIIQRENPNHIISEVIASASIISSYKRLYHTIPIRCAGLLEFGRGAYERMPTAEEADKCPDMEVRFIHRTAREFLTGTAEGQEILKHDTSSYEARFCSVLHAWLSRSYVFRSLKSGNAHGIVALQSYIVDENVALAILQAQKTLSKTTWLAWLEIWEAFLFEMPEKYLNASGFDMLCTAAQQGIKNFLDLSLRRFPVYNPNYKSYILYSASYYKPETVKECFVWFDILDLLLSHGCKPQKGSNRSSFFISTFDPLETFLWNLGRVASSDYFLLSDALCNRALKVLRHFVDCGADMSQATYCFFDAETIQNDRGRILLGKSKVKWWEESISVVLLSWPIFGVLQHFAQAFKNSYFGHLLAEFLSIQKWDGYLTQPKIIAIGKGKNSDWSSCAKKVTPTEEKRILGLILSPIPWDAEGYRQKVETLQKVLDHVIEEALYNEGEPQDLTDHLLFEVGLDEARPESLLVWLYKHKAKLSKREEKPMWKFLTEEP